MNIIKNIKNIFMPRAKTTKTTKTKNVETDEVVNSNPPGFNETTGQALTVESFTAYIENMKENDPKKYAKKKDELEKKLSELKNK